jgi:glycosyltransferase A (GT-A) superfamily protein (DUF2064 family)
MAGDLAHLLARTQQVPVWHVAGPLSHDWVKQLTGRVTAQATGDLGERIQAALGEGPGLALGIDAPSLPASLLLQAIHSTADVILGPAFDGGCWCIGQSRHHPGWLSRMGWSNVQVCAELFDRARGLDLGIEVLPYWSDVDTLDDLRLLEQQLRMLPSTEAPHTRTWLKLNPEHTWRI